MNTLIIKQGVQNHCMERINACLKNRGVLLITKTNIYKSYDHIIQASLYPQYELIDNINQFMEEESTSLIFDMWDRKINELSGQDVDTLLLSVLSSFINNMPSPKYLIVDCFDELSTPVKKRITEIQNKANYYGVNTYIYIHPKQEKYSDLLIMNANNFYIPKIDLNIKSNVLSMLSKNERNKLSSLKPNQLLYKDNHQKETTIKKKQPLLILSEQSCSHHRKEVKMANIMNRWSALGRLASDPKEIETKNENVMCFITLSITRPSNTDVTDFIDVAVYGKRAEALLEYKQKGDELLVEAELQTYQDENNHTKQVLSATDIIYLRSTQKKEQGTFK